MIGPYWSVESNAWLRVNVAETGHVTAEMAFIDEHNPYLTTPWQPIAPNTWHIIDDHRHGYYHINNGVLYRYDGKSSITGLPIVSRYSHLEPHWNPEKSNPFGDGVLPTSPLVDEFQFPLTPEQQTTQWQALQQANLLARVEPELESPFNEEQRTELLSLAPLPLTGFEARNYPTYDAYLAALRDVVVNDENQFHIAINTQASRTVDYSTLHDSPIDPDSLFLMKKRFFLELLAKVYNHIRQQFHLPEETLEIIVDPAHPMDRTAEDAEQFAEDRIDEYFDDDFPPPSASDEWQGTDEDFIIQPLVDGLGFRTTGIMYLARSTLSIHYRQELLARMIACMEGFFGQHYINLSAYYTNLLAVIEDSTNEHHQAIQALVFEENTDIDQEMNPTHDEEITIQLQLEKRNFLFSVLRTELRNIGKHILNATEDELLDQNNESSETPHADTSQNKLHPRTSPLDQTKSIKKGGNRSTHMTPETRIAKMINSVATAQHKYAEWYSGQQPHRGANGFFSWLRHGAYGQNLAKKFNTDISALSEEQPIINKINELLTDHATQYHRHSFASFLLDELRMIKGSSWSKLSYLPSSNHYDKDIVTTQLIGATGRYTHVN